MIRGINLGQMIQLVGGEGNVKEGKGNVLVSKEYCDELPQT